MVATIAFGMASTSPVRFVAHLDLPKSIEAITRKPAAPAATGCLRTPGWPTACRDVVQLRRMIQESEAGEAQKRIQAGKLDAMLGLCETADAAACGYSPIRRGGGALRAMRHLFDPPADLRWHARRAAAALLRVPTGQRSARCT